MGWLHQGRYFSNEWVVATPLKTNECPLRIDGWFRCIPYWNGHFLGDIRSFSGVYIHVLYQDSWGREFYSCYIHRNGGRNSNPNM